MDVQAKFFLGFGGKIMENRQRFSIRRKIQLMITLIITVALLITSAVGVIAMIRIRTQAANTLLFRMEHNLYNIAANKAEIADLEFSRYISYTSSFADYIHELYVNPDDYVSREIYPPNLANMDKYSIQRYLTSEDVRYEDVSEECKLLGNVEQVFAPVVKESDGEILAIYVSTESGLQISYDKDTKLTAKADGSEVYYNYFSRPWYIMGKQQQKVCFTNVYEDSYDRGFMITSVAPFYDENDNFAGVVCMDMLIDDIYSILVDVDILEGDGDYAFLVDGNGYAVAPQFKDINIADDPDIDDAICDRIMNDETGVDLSSNGCYFAYTPIDSVGWTLCLRVPQNLILEPVNDMNEKILSSMLIFVGIFVVIMIFIFVIVRQFSLSITKPLFALRQDAKEISNGNLEHVAAIYNNDEIGDLAISFNNMAVSLKEYITNLTKVTAEKERIGAELNVATQIQADMLPRIFPPFPEKKEFDLYATMNPAKEVGGDFYDFFLIDDDHLCMVMADVSGKGVPAALFMVIAKTLIKNHASMGASPSEVLKYANEQLLEGNEAELFVTVWIGILEISTGRGIAANAGHEYPAVKRAGGDYELVKYRHAPAVATVEGINFKEHEFELHPGDSLFVYTDGVPEAANTDNEFFGTDRMLDVLNDNKESTVEDVLKNMKSSIDDFVGEASQFDDITMLVLHYYGPQNN